MRVNFAATLLGLVLLGVGVGMAVGVGWALAGAGVALLVVGLLRDDGKETRR